MTEKTMAERVAEFSKHYTHARDDLKAFLYEGKAGLPPDTRNLLCSLGFMNPDGELRLEFVRIFMATHHTSRRGLATSSNL